MMFKKMMLVVPMMFSAMVSADVQKLAIFGAQAAPDPGGRGPGFPEIPAPNTGFCVENCGFLDDYAVRRGYVSSDVKSSAAVQADTGLAPVWQQAYLSGDHPWGTLCLTSDFPTPDNGLRCTNSWLNFRANDLSQIAGDPWYSTGRLPSVRYRVQFDVPSFAQDADGRALAASMVVKMKADNWGKVWINGQEVPGTIWGSSHLNGTAQFASSVKEGLNSIELVVGDDGGLAGFTYLIELKMEADGPLTTLPADEPVDLDSDDDGYNDDVDNCVNIANPDQADLDGDEVGDICDADLDGDGFNNDSDNCIFVANNSQLDFDGDLLGDACDPDRDGDGLNNDIDVCLLTTADNGIPSIEFKHNRFADIDGDGLFDTLEGNKKNNKTFSLSDTGGCSCGQIIDQMGLGNGHVKYGCSGGVIEAFIKNFVK